METKIRKFEEKQKFKRIEDNESDDGEFEEILDAYSLFNEKANTAHDSSNSADSSSDSDIDIV